MTRKERYVQETLRSLIHECGVPETNASPAQTDNVERKDAASDWMKSLRSRVPKQCPR